ncbi:MAG TPA: T9SS type A sorting domain-containing protein [Chitinophagales bacterium]|nr:T9SS type A sorting domain-containing protein [Chitinophagales bacterium]
MKKFIPAILLFLVPLTASTQTHWNWFNPFNFPVATGYPAGMCKDASGQFWFASDSLGSLIITNQAGSVSYTIPDAVSFSYERIFVDSRNDIWLIQNGVPVFLQNGQVKQLDIPALQWPAMGNVMDIADDNHGNNYISIFKNDIDSFHIVKFDGTNYTELDLSTLQAGLRRDLIGAGSLICDALGSPYGCFPNYGVFKYSGQTWTLVDTSHVIPVVADRGNNVYFEKSPGLSANLDNNYYLLKISDSASQRFLLPSIDMSLAVTYYSLSLDQEDRMCLVMHDKYMFRLEDTVWQGVYLPDFCCNFGNPWAIPPVIFDSLGNIWMSNDMASKEIGIYSFKGHQTFSGNVFIDYNQNQLRDSADLPLAGINIGQTPQNLIANTDVNGDYSMIFLDNNITYALQAPALQYYAVSSGTNIQLNPASDSGCCYNIAYTPLLSVQDLEINATAGFARPGFEVPHWFTFKNKGTIAVSDTVEYVFDSSYVFISAQPAPDMVNGNVLKWGFVNLQPFETRSISMDLQLSVSAVLGDTLTNTATIYPASGDTTPVNNVSVCSQVVVGSFDPNEKTVTPAGGTSAGDYLTYTIFFQNTGTDTAFNIFVRDTLDAGIDFASFEILGCSHAMEYIFKGSGVIEFRFPNILLPDSHRNEALSHGFVKYRVKTKNNLPMGSEVKNTGFIYFDFNTPIQTNTTISNVGFLGLPRVLTKERFKIYPNPNTGVFTIELRDETKADKIIITDMAGRQIYTAPVTGSSICVFMQNFSAGVYMVSTISHAEVTGRSRIVLK